MPIYSAKNQADSGCRSALTRRAWKHFYRKQIFAGSFSTRTAWYLENRVRVAGFTRPVIRRWDQRLSRAILTQAGKSGARTKATRATQPTGNFTATSVSIFPWNIWDRSRAESENFPA